MWGVDGLSDPPAGFNLRGVCAEVSGAVRQQQGAYREVRRDDQDAVLGHVGTVRGEAELETAEQPLSRHRWSAMNHARVTFIVTGSGKFSLGSPSWPTLTFHQSSLWST